MSDKIFISYHVSQKKWDVIFKPKKVDQKIIDKQVERYKKGLKIKGGKL